MLRVTRLFLLMLLVLAGPLTLLADVTGKVLGNGIRPKWRGRPESHRDPSQCQHRAHAHG